MSTRRGYVTFVCAGLGLLFGLSSQPSLGIGGQFGMEFAIDAPWRLEPVTATDGSVSYGPIPISITFLDAVFETARSPVSDYTSFNSIDVGRLREVQVVEWVDGGTRNSQPSTTIKAAQFREIERKALVSTKTAEPDHYICHPGAGQSCDEALRISNAHEWHGMFWYTPKLPVTKGRNIHLEVTVITEQAALYTREWKNYLVVHAGDAPLPRFGDQWLYGDLHYHSQMTDNEGESGYSYRNVARALGASGMDFVFATDHASNGTQTDGKIAREFCADRSQPNCIEARDFNEHRYRVAKNLLYGNAGINAEIALDAPSKGLARLRSANILPQVFLGEEIDVQVEMSAAEFADGNIRYGDGRKYAWPNSSSCLEHSSTAECKRKYSQAVDGGYVVLDEQGIPIEEKIEEALGTGTVNDIVKRFTPDLTQSAPSRQHMVYFPMSVSQNTDGWIASDTGPYGGASKRIARMISEVQAGGVAFLAHPLENSRPGSPAGPDIVPYTEQELDHAWRSPAILGLQFWNEDHRRISAPDTRNPTVMRTGARSDNARALTFYFQWPFQGHEYGNFPWNWQRMVQPAGMSSLLYHSAFTWDKYLRKGVDAAQLGSLSWLTQGEPRRWFMAGGSDSHGDFNYRRTGTPGIDRWTDVPVVDTAIGLPRNLVSMDEPAGAPVMVEAGDPPRTDGPKHYTNQQVIASLRAGRFSVTDGPALRIAVDRNLNGKIDEADTPMGGVMDFFAGDRIPLLVEWKSTAEFGPITRVDVYVGNDRITFAPKDHGPGTPGGVGQAGYGSYAPDTSGALQVSLADIYGRFNRAPQPAQIAYHGVATIYLGPAQFAMARSEGALSYVRAFATTIPTHNAADLGICPKSETAGNKCGSRYAYSNPVWTRYHAACPPKRRTNSVILGTTGVNRSSKPLHFVDGNANRVPDVCENTLRDACPTANPATGSITTSPLTAATDESTPANPGHAAPADNVAMLSESTATLVMQPIAERAIPQTSCQVLSSTP